MRELGAWTGERGVVVWANGAVVEAVVGVGMRS